MKDRKTYKNVANDPEYPGLGAHSIPVRPQKPRDGYGYGGGTYTSGKAPIGGYQAVWNYSGNPNEYKNSPTTKPEKGSV